ncbi:unnamed protein product [Gadus morhua 'NCC']
MYLGLAMSPADLQRPGHPCPLPGELDPRPRTPEGKEPTPIPPPIPSTTVGQGGAWIGIAVQFLVLNSYNPTLCFFGSTN